MNTILRRITTEMYETNLDYFYKRCGNYKVIRDGFFITHYYFGNIICKVNLINKEFRLFDCGYKKYTLTTAQLNYLENFYKNKNYKLVYKGY